MSFGKVQPEQAEHPSFLCAQLPQVPVADMAQKDLPALTSLTSPRIISATTARSARRINIVDMLLDTYSNISYHFGPENRPLASFVEQRTVPYSAFAASTARSVSLVAS